MFKIVQTVEEQEICLTVVPSKWEKDGILFWPKLKLVNKIVRDSCSEPGLDWTKMACVVKRKANTYAEAEEELRIMEKQPDTDVEINGENHAVETMAVEPPPKKQRFATIDLSSYDFNDLLETTVNNEPTDIASADGLPTSTPIVVPDQLDVSGLFELGRSIAESVNIILSNQAVLERNQTSIVQAVARLETKIDFYFGGPEKQTSESKTTKTVMNPINSKQEFDEFEESLQKSDVKQRLIEGMTFICGTTGRKNGIDCAYKLIDYVFTREFFTKVSWTGATRASKPDSGEEHDAVSAEAGPLKEKVPFKYYNRTRDFFMALINKADSSFAELDLDKFFKVVIKNSVQRLNSKNQTSASKKRPSNLQYKRKAQDSKAGEPSKDE